LFIGRFLFACNRRLTSRAKAEAVIAAERAAILALVRGTDPVRGRIPVLIPRPRGLEDSSRHWSIFMTLEHLVIVNRAIARTINALVADELPPGVASTAAVKPSPAAGASVVPEFEQSCDELTRAGAQAASLRTRLRFAHPWFGPLDAADWKVMGGSHLRLHRPQLVLIQAALANGTAG
jgi:hypothetical protein